ncbi:MAG TPA: IS1 family transposase [Candidatus Sulfotelmatobacter sp.]|nr:IS1 family transposase [Candidatus Sulfotelmatobacter sp.]
MTCVRCQHQSCKKFGYFGKRRIQRWRCNSCNSTFCEPAAKLGTHYTDPETAAKALTLMLEGMSVRAISRVTGLHKTTILALMSTAAENVTRLMNTRMRGVRTRYIQSDEIWCFVGKKRRNVRTSDPAEVGDQWVFVAMDAETKLVPSFVIGKRTRETTLRFLRDLQSRLSDARFQLTTDGFHFYERGVEDVFGGTVDFAQLVKLFGDFGQSGDERYSPPRITEVISKVRDGRPDPAHISTSHIERQNLTMRMQMRRFTRLTNAFSKKLENLEAAVRLYFAWYNFCRVHQTLRVTPAMESGLADHAWTMRELLETQA